MVNDTFLKNLSSLHQERSMLFKTLKISWLCWGKEKASCLFCKDTPKYDIKIICQFGSADAFLAIASYTACFFGVIGLSTDLLAASYRWYTTILRDALTKEFEIFIRTYPII